MIQHEIDHLDGVLILDRTSREQRKEAMRALREASRPPDRRRAGPTAGPSRAIACGPSTSAPPSSPRRCCAGLRTRRTARRSSSPAPTARGAAAGSWPRRRSPTRRASWGSALDQPASVNDEPALRAIAAARPEAVCVCAFGALIKEPLLSRYQMLNVHPSLLPRWRGAAPIERAIIAGDERHRRLDHARAGRLDSGPVCLRPTEPIAARRHLRDPGGPARGARRRSCSSGRWTSGRLRRAGRGAASPTPTKIDAGGSPARSVGRPAVELERVVRALTPHIGAHLELRRRHRARGQRGPRGPRAAGRRRGAVARGAAPGARMRRGRARAARRAAARAAPDERRGLPARAAAVDAACRRPGPRARSRRRARARCASSAGCSSRARTPTARCTAEAAGARAARPGARDGARLRHRPAARDARPRRGAADRSPARAARPAGAGAAAARAVPAALLGGVAEHAAVNESVELAKRTSPRAAGLVNAVLRRATREGPGCWSASTRPTTTAGPAAATRYSVPGWLAASGGSELGAEEARALLRVVNEPAESALRVNSLVARSLGGRRRPLPVPAAGAGAARGRSSLDGPFDVQAPRCWRAGRGQPQSRASMLVARMLGPRAGRARARPVRGPGRQDHPPGRADGRSGRARGGRAPPRPGRRRSRATCARMRRRVRAGRGRRDAASRVGLRRAVRPGAGRPAVQRARHAAVAARPALAGAAGGDRRARGAAEPRSCRRRRALASRRGARLLGLHDLPRRGRRRGRARSCASTTRRTSSVERRESVQLLPHRDGTDGFFIARLRRPLSARRRRLISDVGTAR